MRWIFVWCKQANQYHVNKPTTQEDNTEMYGGHADGACWFFSALNPE